MKPTVTLSFDSVADMIAFFQRPVGMAEAAGFTVVPTSGFAAPVATSEDDDNGPVNNTAPNVDARNIPHDPRIHAAKKTLNADGTWRRRRGVTEQEVAAVEAELMNRTAQPAPAVAQYQFPPGPYASPAPVGNVPALPQSPAVVDFQQPPAYVAPVTQAPQQYAPQPDQPIYQQPAQAPQYTPQPDQPIYQQPAPAPVAPTAPQPQELNFQQFMGIMQQALTQPGANGRPPVDQTYIATLVGQIGQMSGQQISNITDLHAKPELIGLAVSILRRDGVIA